ncbi:MAG: DNA (cytosine-5-)-methyltransferase [Desulfocapsa sp.]|nr:MAG: DNA (cytosine-5-)-methyltransferase [Desulfocapsa sp.]
MRYLSMFSGIEAASQAWEPRGWRAAAFAEIEKFPSAVLAHHYPNVPNLGNVEEANFDTIGPIDLAVFGSPCQSYSIAGKRLGLDDPRGNLALVAGKIVFSKHPRWFVFENVPGLLSSNNGWDFGTLLAAYAGYVSGSAFRPPEGGWRTGGVVECSGSAIAYGLAWRVLDAQYIRTHRFPRAVPQRRRRVFIVGYLGDWRAAAAVLFERESLRWNPPPCRKAGPITPTHITTGAGVSGADGSLIPSSSDISHCLNAGAMGRLDYETETFIAFNSRQDPEVTNDRSGPLDTCIPQVQAVASTLKANNGGGGIGSDPSETFVPTIHHKSTVRRLTPTECARLQGFPDDWCRIPWRGKPAEQCPDTPQYKAYGNSMAVNVMDWIGERIDAVDNSHCFVRKEEKCQ